MAVDFITPTRRRVGDANNFINSSIWLCIGRTSPWTDDLNPPALSDTVKHVTQPQFYKLFETAAHVQQDASGPISVNNVSYKIITPAVAYDSDIRYVYVEFILDHDAIPNPNLIYRQAGVYSGVKLNPGISGSLVANSDIEFPGFLYRLENLEPIYIQPMQREIYKYIFRF